LGFEKTEVFVAATITEAGVPGETGCKSHIFAIFHPRNAVLPLYHGSPWTAHSVQRKETEMNTAFNIANAENRANEHINLAGDMFQTVGLAAAAGVAVALVSGLLVLLIALAGA
jgi:hypothetical protein